jgi:hypothetical protein
VPLKATFMGLEAIYLEIGFDIQSISDCADPATMF